MTSKLTRKRLEKIKSWRETYGAGSNVMLPAEEAEELARIALAAMDSEPVMLYRQVNPVNGMKTYWAELDPEEFRHLKQHTDENAEFMTLYRHAQQPVVPDESYQQLSDLYHAQEKRLFKIAQRIKGASFDKYSHSPSQAIDVLEVAIFGEDEACRAAMLQAGNSPVIPEGYVMVPRVATEKTLIAGLEEANPLGALIDWDASRGDCNTRKQVQEIFKAMLAAAPQPQNAQQNIPEIIPGWIPVSERMPENKPGCYEYLVFETLNNRVNHDYWNVPDKGDDAFTPFWNYYGEHVTHWMPMPAAPEEVK